MSKQQDENEIKILSYFSKYPMNKVTDSGKEILYKGTVDKIPAELKDKVTVDESRKYVLIYKDK